MVLNSEIIYRMEDLAGFFLNVSNDVGLIVNPNIRKNYKKFFQLFAEETGRKPCQLEKLYRAKVILPYPCKDSGMGLFEYLYSIQKDRRNMATVTSCIAYYREYPTD